MGFSVGIGLDTCAPLGYSRRVMRASTIDQRRRNGYYPYYKAQWWDVVNLSWHDVQKRFPSGADAHRQGPNLFPPGVPPAPLRVVEVTRQGRQPLVP